VFLYLPNCMNIQIIQLFATCLCAFRECSDAIQDVVVEMASIANDPEATPEEREGAVATIAEALFPSGDSGSLGVDLETAESLERHGPGKAVLDELDDEESTFAERLAALLKKEQMTQVQLAEMIGVGQPAVSMMLSRSCRPQRRTVEKIAGALGVAAEELWPGFHQSVGDP
jgi:predicted XRE-type DNA-binding protein